MSADLSGKMLTFPEVSEGAYVNLVPDSKNLTALTVCLRFFSDTADIQSLFAFKTGSSSFILYKHTNGYYAINHNGKFLGFRGLVDIPNQWTAVCATWKSQTGIAQLWVNGKPSTRKGVNRGSYISGAPNIILGQDQNLYSRKFFTGMVMDVHMWDSVSFKDIEVFMHHNSKETNGNVINWRSLDYTIEGYVIVEDSLMTS